MEMSRSLQKLIAPNHPQLPPDIVTTTVTPRPVDPFLRRDMT